MARTRSYPHAVLCALGIALFATPAHAGVVNPDISVVGQPFSRWTTDPGDPARKRVTLDVGETELIFDAALNPYARGTFTASLTAGGIELEEGFFLLTRGLPWGLSVKGGKYRVPFGKLNPAHPHTYPFADRFGVLQAYLPGQESFDETGVELSKLVGLPHDIALTVSADWLKGDTFRIARTPGPASNDPLAADPASGDQQNEPRPGALGRIATFVPIGERSGIELGVSGTSGTNNVAAGTRSTVLGGDAKLKYWTSPGAYLLVQGEVLHLDRQNAAWDSSLTAYAHSDVTPFGGYLFADYNWATRYDVGASYEHWQDPTPDQTGNQSFGAFAGLALMEETTSFRLDWRATRPGRPPGATQDPETIHTITLRVLFSMGPHKAHQF
jgi:hypothetical protein